MQRGGNPTLARHSRNVAGLPNLKIAESSVSWGILNNLHDFTLPRCGMANVNVKSFLRAESNFWAVISTGHGLERSR